MTLKRQQRNKPKGNRWTKPDAWPHQYAELISAGKKTMQEVPTHLQAWVATHVEILKHSDERLAVKFGAQIALKKSLWERRQALAAVPTPLRERTEYHARHIFERLKQERQQK